MKRIDDERARRLMGRVLDGEATPEEERTLEELFEERPELRVEYGELRELGLIFREVPRKQAAPDFGDQVMRRVFESPFRTEVWPQLMPVIRRLSLAACVLILVAGFTASVEGVGRAPALFHPLDPQGVTPLRPGMGDLGHHLLVESSEDLAARLMREFTLEAATEVSEGGGDR